MALSRLILDILFANIFLYITATYFPDFLFHFQLFKSNASGLFKHCYIAFKCINLNYRILH